MTGHSRGIRRALPGMLLMTGAGAAADTPAVLPMRLVASLPIVHAQVGDEDVQLVFDSGNSGSLSLTQAVIDRVHATPTGETSRGMDAQGNVIVYPKYKIPQVRLGAAVFANVIVELDVHDPSYQATQVGQEGFLGTALLKPYEVVLDYAHRTMSLQTAACQGPSVPFSPQWHGEPVTETATDLGVVTLWWDTGTPAMVLSRRFIQTARPHLLENALTTKQLLLGGANFGPIQFQIWDLALPPGFDGFIGSDFFAQHVVCLDFPRSQIVIPTAPIK
jgi:hypothetical protein